MSQIFEELAALDKLIHEPARLAILTALSACESADFLFLGRLTGLSKGNLSSHLSKLEEAELVDIVKQFVGKKPNTVVSLTENGRIAITQHWQQLDNLRNGAQAWEPE
ncbi:transcriptional regulator [Candidatus Leptofilum sp.]|uniref:transcriptional regulator n=1 Tax=Candidatus Leptofilum sp. TaxID=3241576 RepID=UPI003B58DD81